jgi:ribosomal protein S18 acetylase RimI-like enzyme
VSLVTDTDLYLRGTNTLVASWEQYAREVCGAALVRSPGVAVGVFPNEPERSVYNNALFDRGLALADRVGAADVMESSYRQARITRFAAWVHETDAAMRGELERRRYTVTESTRAMGMTLDEIRLPRSDVFVTRADWSEHQRVGELPPGLLAAGDHASYHVLVARLAGENVATALAFDRDGDCGIYNVGTLEHARRRGLGTAVTVALLYDAIDRGCRTASLQSTPMAERVYTSMGFRDLGLILEYAPVQPAAVSSGS